MYSTYSRFLAVGIAVLMTAGTALAQSPTASPSPSLPPSPTALKAEISELRQKGIRTPLKAERECLKIQLKSEKASAQLGKLERRAAFSLSIIQAKKAALEALKSDPNISAKELEKINKKILRLDEDAARKTAQIEKMRASLISRTNLERSRLNARTAAAVIRLEEKKAKIIALAQALIIAFPAELGYAEALAEAQALDFSQSGFICQ